MLRRTWMAWAVVLLLVVAALTASGITEAGGKKAVERPIGSVVITGELEDRVFLTFEQ
jgi:hypothetical protein